MQDAWKHSREFTRCKTALEVEIIAAERHVAGETRDVSLAGIYFYGERSLPAGTPCRVTIFVGGRESGARIEASGRIARVDAHGMAVAFDALDLDGYQHLKQVVLLNAADPDQAAGEIEQHVGLRRRD
ncbi:MAG: PilZ domain-containing protein [Deltaproteobacteria bacterium]|nr:PilZ domain-containing protein [Deltaproteobacteria bacterium]